MRKADALFLKYNALIIIVGTLLNNLSIKYLVAHGNSSSTVLVYRSVITLLLTVALSARYKVKIFPTNLKRQLLFMLNAGVSLLFLFQSYVYLKAATVSMVQRLDIPAAVLIGHITGKRKGNFKVGFSILAFCIVISIFFFSHNINEQPKGLALALIAITMTSYSYILIKRSTGEENSFVIVNTVNIGCIIVGLVSGLVAGNLQVIELSMVWVFALASLSQFLLNYSMTILYKHHDVERGRRPYLVAAFIVLFVEQFWMGEVFDSYHTLIIILVIAVIYLVTLPELPSIRKRKKVRDEHEEFTEFN